MTGDQPATGGDTIQRTRSTQLAPPHTRKCNVHCNSLWSLWYGISVLSLQAYIVYKCVRRFLTYISLPWPESQQPYLELNLYVGLVGAAVVLLPFFFISFMFKIGNLANDGYKLGYSLSTCSMDPPSVLARSDGFIRNAWHHGGPTAAFIHLVSAFCFLLPRIIIEAKLIQVGFLSRESIWKTDLDWLVPNNDRLIVLSFFTGGSTVALHAESTTVGTPVHHPADQIRRFLESEGVWEPFSAEYINYGLALVVFAVRYPAVFWKTNKALSFLFSLQLMGNAIQNLMALSAMSVMYKVHVIGPQNVLHKYEPFLLNTPISLLLYILSAIILTASSSVIYMYGYQKFMTFLQTERDKKTIVLAEGKTSLWMYFPHTAALCTLIALVVCNGPLLYDFTIIYKGSLDGTVLVFVIATVLHLFLWIVTWLFLTLKMTWKFKLRVTVGRAAVHNAKSIKLVNDIDLHHHPVDKENAPMLIVGFGKTFTVHDPGPKKLIMKTLARAAMETDKAMEDEETYWLKGDTPSKANGPGTATLMRVHASPNLNKKSEAVESQCSSPRRLNASPLTSTVQDTDDRIPKESIYGTVRPKGKHRPLGELEASGGCIPEEDVDVLPPPPHDEEDGGRPLLQPPKPAPRKGPSQEVQDIHTPRSNRSIDSGLPDSSSTTSSTSPPGQHGQPYSEADSSQNHRKSTSLDNINLQQNGGQQQQQQPQQPHWKSYSLQRGLGPDAEALQQHEEAAAALHVLRSSSNSNNNAVGVGAAGALSSHSSGGGGLAAGEEDIYGRCTNMRLTSFTEAALTASAAAAAVRDPRIIDLAQCTAGAAITTANGPVMAAAAATAATLTGASVSSSFCAVSGLQNGGIGHHPHHLSAGAAIYPPAVVNNFNTLPVHLGGGHHMAAGGALHSQQQLPGLHHHQHNTLPARVGESPPRSTAALHHQGVSAAAGVAAASGRHFKPFDHRRMNPMAEIQENPYELQASSDNHNLGDPYHHHSQAVGNSSSNNTTFVVHHNTHIPYMPSELRHTNYGSKTQLLHPQVMQHRDSANYSLASSDSG